MTYRNSINEKGHPKIVVSKFGEVKPQEIDYILAVVEERAPYFKALEC